jgi:hypothetical protein
MKNFLLVLKIFKRIVKKILELGIKTSKIHMLPIYYNVLKFLF